MLLSRFPTRHAREKSLALSALLHLALAAVFLWLHGPLPAPATFKWTDVQILEKPSEPSPPHLVPQKKARTVPASPAPAVPAPRAANLTKPQEPTNAQVSELSLPPSADGGASVDPYLLELVRLLERHQIYPAAAIRREEEGPVLLRFSVAADGALVDPQIEKPSPFELLNRAALETLEKAGRLPPPPARFATPLKVHIPLIFSLQRR